MREKNGSKIWSKANTNKIFAKPCFMVFSSWSYIHIHPWLVYRSDVGDIVSYPFWIIKESDCVR